MSDRTTVIEAEKFVLRDSQGKIRAELALAPDESPTLSLYDKKSQRRMQLAVKADDSPAIMLNGRDGTVLATLEVSSLDIARLRLGDEEGKARVDLQTSNYASDLSFYGSDGLARFMVTTKPREFDRQRYDTTLTLFGEDESRRVELWGAEDGGSYIRFYSREGELCLDLNLDDGPTDEEPWPSLKLMNKDGNWRVMLIVAHDGLPHLAFYDSKGKPRMHLCIDSNG